MPQNLKLLKSIYPKSKIFFAAYRRISKAPKTTTSRINLDKKIHFSHMQGLTLTSDIPDGVQVFVRFYALHNTVRCYADLCIA